jgi:multidrug resistance efflux pump
MQNNMKRIIPILVVLILSSAAAYYYFKNVADKGTEILTASGTVEAVEVVVSIEVGGQIAQVMVEEGDLVQAGDVLVRFEDEMLQAQYEQAKAALSQAQVNYDLIAAQPLSEQRQVAISAAALELLSAEQALQNLIDNADLRRAHAQQAVEDAEEALEDLLNPELQQAIALEAIAVAEKMIDQAEKRARNLKSTAGQADIDAADAEVVLARDALDKAQDDFEPYAGKPEDNLNRALYQSRLAAAQQIYDATIRKYNALSGTGADVDIAVADADLATAQAQLEEAQREYERIKDGPSKADVAVLKAQIDVAKREYAALKNGPDPDDLALVEAQVQRAKVNQVLAQADTIQEQLDVARAQVNAAEASLGVIQTQINKQVLIAPVGGTVLYRSVEEGEVVMPGSVAVTIGNLDDLTITVYVPEDRYGQIGLGDQAVVKIDSFPGKTFTGDVIRIADRAEYTPRNVQTAEGRRTTVFAVELSVDDPDGNLKPGMPADVEFRKP